MQHPEWAGSWFYLSTQADMGEAAQQILKTLPRLADIHGSQQKHGQTQESHQ